MKFGPQEVFVYFGFGVGKRVRHGIMAFVRLVEQSFVSSSLKKTCPEWKRFTNLDFLRTMYCAYILHALLNPNGYS